MTAPTVMVLVDHEHGAVEDVSFQSMAFARSLASPLGAGVEAAVIGQGAEQAVEKLAKHEVERAHVVFHPILTDYAPEAWAEALAQLVARTIPLAVVSIGSDRGHEVMAHLAAIADLPLAANVVEVDATPDVETWELTRLRWGGSLLERAALTARIKLFTVAPHHWTAPTPADARPVETLEFVPDLDGELARTRIVERVTVHESITLASAPVVVSGGRGVGSAEGFGLLEELAELLGGAVGCSRVVTNNGWRPHSDQVGQTGTRVAPDLYIACGISGAIQHWVGMMTSKKVLAINIDPDAPMVTKADWAVIGDVHEILPALIEEVNRRKGVS